MNRSETIGKLAEALAAAQGQLESVAKQSKGYHYTYADLAQVWDSIRKPLSSNGLAVVQTTDSDDVGNPEIITTLIHTSGEWISGKLLVKPVKPDPQALGSAITYGRRYALMGMVGVAPADDDGAAASNPAAKGAGPPLAREPSTKLRQQFMALWGKCLKANIDPRELETISPSSSDDEIMEAGIHNKALLDEIENPEGS